MSAILELVASATVNVTASTTSYIIAQSSDTTVMQTVGAAGIILCTAGFFYRMTISVSQNALDGKPADLFMIGADLALNILFITYIGRIIASAVWDIGHFMGDQISGDLSVADMMDKLKAVNLNNYEQAKNSKGILDTIKSVFSFINGVGTSVVVGFFTAIIGLLTYVLMTMVKFFFDNLQIVMFNIAYVFSPLLVGLGSFGETLEMGGKMKAIKLWIDISAWSITMGVIILTFKNIILARIQEIDTSSMNSAAGHASTKSILDNSSIILGEAALTIFIFGCILAIPSITSTILGGSGSALAAAGRTFTTVAASVASKGLSLAKK